MLQESLSGANDDYEREVIIQEFMGEKARIQQAIAARKGQYEMALSAMDQVRLHARLDPPSS